MGAVFISLQLMLQETPLTANSRSSWEVKSKLILINYTTYIVQISTLGFQMRITIIELEKNPLKLIGQQHPLCHPPPPKKKN